MKTWKNLMPLVAEMENLYNAFWKAKRGKEKKQEVQAYGDSLDENLYALSQQLETGEVTAGDYRFFKIYDPKERMVCAAPFAQRVLHHALMNVCGPLLDKKQIFDSYACRRGKGQYAALERAQMFHAKYKWCLKLDIRKYFDSIDHDILKQKLARTFSDCQLLNVLFKIMDSYESESGKGHPIGNLTSQYFANHYLCALDHCLYERLHVAAYVRYMDDMLIWSDDREELLDKGKSVRSLLDGLHLKLKVFSLRRTAQTTEFLGYRLKGKGLLLSQRSMKRYSRRMVEAYRLYKCGFWDEENLTAHIRPMTAFVMKADSYNFRKKTLAKLEKYEVDFPKGL